MAFPINPVEGDTYTENNTVWIYSAVAGQWNRSIISQVNETTYIGSDGAPGGIGGNTQVIFNDNGSLASDAGLVFNKTTDALTIAGPVIHSLGTAALPAITPSGDLNTGIYSPGADQVAISTNGTGRLFVDSSGNVGVGSSPNSRFAIFGDTSNVRIQQSGGVPSGLYGYEITPNGTQIDASFKALGVTGELRISSGRSAVWGGFTSFYTDTTEKMRLTSAGRLGIGNTAPAMSLHVGPGASSFTTPDGAGVNVTPQAFNSQTSGVAALGVGVVDGVNNRRASLFVDQPNSIWGLSVNYSSGEPSFVIRAASNERLRIDSSGRLLVGTSTSASVAGAAAISQIVTGANIGLSILRHGDVPILALGATGGSPATIVTSGQNLGEIRFAGADGTDINTMGASIVAIVDGTPGENDLPSRLVFSTTADGASSPTERLRITSAGVLQIADAGNIAVGTTTGTKIGTATTQKLGFFNKTPVVQPTAVADATDAASVITQLNALLSRMRDLGLIAT